MKKHINILVVAFILSPSTAFAELTGVKDLIQATGSLINPLIGVLVGAALLAFLWGLAKFIFRLGGDGEKAVEEGKRIMKWGLIALFVMVSVWGIISFIQAAILPGGGATPTSGGGSGYTPSGGDFPFTPFFPPGEGGI